MDDNKENKVTSPFIKTTEPRINTPNSKSKLVQKKTPSYTGSGPIFKRD